MTKSIQIWWSRSYLLSDRRWKLQRGLEGSLFFGSLSLKQIRWYQTEAALSNCESIKTFKTISIRGAMHGTIVLLSSNNIICDYRIKPLCISLLPWLLVLRHIDLITVLEIKKTIYKGHYVHIFRRKEWRFIDVMTESWL